MKKIVLPNDLTYVALFLTFRCSFTCPYCINKIGHLTPRKELTAEDWITGLNRLIINPNAMVPITIQGGEPSKHEGFIEIIKNLDEAFYIDILTNLDFDIKKFMCEIPPERLRRDVPYASIRVSYHPADSQIDSLLSKILLLQNSGYSIGLFAVKHPENGINEVRNKAEKLGIDFRTKDFLGAYNGNEYGEYKYNGACYAKELKKVECKSKELLMAPDGSIHKCHSDLYKGELPLGNILDDNLNISFVFRVCYKYGECNPCDIKLKTNRFQKNGHCAVEICGVDG